MVVNAEYEFNPEKNRKLKEERGISFDEIICLIESGFLLGVLIHPNQERYPGQKIYAVDVDGYVYYVPFIRNGNKIFLKTLFPNRKATKDYKKEKQSCMN